MRQQGKRDDGLGPKIMPRSCHGLTLLSKDYKIEIVHPWRRDQALDGVALVGRFAKPLRHSIAVTAGRRVILQGRVEL